MKIRNLFISLVLLAGLIVLTSPATFATPWYVDNQIGNDGRDGSSPTILTPDGGVIGPKKTLSGNLIGAIAAATAGDTIYVANTGIAYGVGTTEQATISVTKKLTFRSTGGAVTISSLFEVNSTGTIQVIFDSGNFTLFGGLTLTSGVLSNPSNLLTVRGTITRSIALATVSSQLNYTQPINFSYGALMTTGNEFPANGGTLNNISTTAGVLTIKTGTSITMTGVFNTAAAVNLGTGVFTITNSGVATHTLAGNITNGTLAFSLGGGAVTVNGAVTLPTVSATTSTTTARTLDLNGPTAVTGTLTASLLATITSSGNTLVTIGTASFTDDVLILNGTGVINPGTSLATINGNVLLNTAMSTTGLAGGATFTFASALTVNGNVTNNASLTVTNAATWAGMTGGRITFGDVALTITGNLVNSTSIGGATGALLNVSGFGLITFANTTSAVTVNGAINNSSNTTLASATNTAAFSGNGLITFGNNLSTGIVRADGGINNSSNYAGLTGAANVNNGQIIIGGAARTGVSTIGTSANRVGAITNSSLGAAAGDGNGNITFGNDNATTSGFFGTSVTVSGSAVGGYTTFANENFDVSGNVTNSRTNANVTLAVGTGAGLATRTVTVGGNIVNSGTGTISFLVSTSGNVLVTGSVQSSSTGTITWPNISSGTFTIGGLIVSNGTVTVPVSHSVIITVNGTVNVSGGNVNLLSSGAGPTITMTGNSIAFTGGTITTTGVTTLNLSSTNITIGGASSNSTFATAGTAIVIGNPTFPNLTTITIGLFNPVIAGDFSINTNNGLAQTVNITGGTLTVTGILTIATSSTSSLVNIANQADITVVGAFVNTTGYTTTEQGRITIGGSVAQTFGGAGVFGTIEFKNVAGIATSTPVTLAGTIYLTSGVVSNTGGAITINNSTSLPTVVLNAGSFAVGQTPTYTSNVNITYIGTDKTTGNEMPTVATKLQNLTVATTNGALAGHGIVTLAASATVNGILTVNSGQALSILNTFTLTMKGPSIVLNGDIINVGTGQIAFGATAGTTVTGPGYLPNVQINAASVGNNISAKAIINQLLGTDGIYAGAADFVVGTAQAQGSLTFLAGTNNATITLTGVTEGSMVGAVTTASANNTLILGGNLVAAGTLTHAAGTINVGTFTFEQRGASITLGATGTASFTGTGLLKLYQKDAVTNTNFTLTSDAAGSTIGVNTELNNADVTVGQDQIVLAGGPLIISGALTVTDGNLTLNQPLTLTGNALTITTNGVVSGASILTLNATVAPMTFSFTGTPSITNLTISNDVNLAGTGSGLTITTAFVHTAGVLNFGSMNLTFQTAFARTAGTAAYQAGTGYMILDAVTVDQGSDGFSVPNLRVNTAGTVTLTSGASEGTVTATKAFDLVAGTFTTNGKLAVSNLATVNYTAGTISAAPAYAGTITLVGLGSTAFPTNIWPATASLVTTLTINGTGTIALPGSRTVNTALNLTGGTLNVPTTFTLTVADGSLITVDAGFISLTGTGAVVYGAGLSVQYVPSAANYVSNGIELPATVVNLSFTRLGNTVNRTTTLGLVGPPITGNHAVTITGTLTIKNNLTTLLGAPITLNGDLIIATDVNALATVPLTTFGDALTLSGAANSRIIVPSTPVTGIPLSALTIAKSNSQRTVTLSGGNLDMSAGIVTFTRGLLVTDSVSYIWINAQVGASGQGFVRNVAAGDLSHVVGNVRKTLKAGTIQTFGRNEIPVGSLLAYCPVAITVLNPGGNVSLGVNVIVTHNAISPTGIVGLPIVDGVSTGVDISRYAALSWSIKSDISLGNTAFDLELTDPSFTAYDDITKVRIIRRIGTIADITNEWSLQGLVADYDNFVVAGSPTVINHNSIGGIRTQGAIFTFGMKSNIVPPTIADVIIGKVGTAYVPNPYKLPLAGKFTGGVGTYTYLASSTNPVVATVVVVHSGTTDTLKVTSLTDGNTTITVKATDANNDFATASFNVRVQSTGVVPPLGLPKEFSLNQNYPNPFNPTTNIMFGVPQNSSVKIAIYDMLGREVATLVNTNYTPGYYTVPFNASKLASGMYIYRMTSQSLSGDQKMFTSTKKLMLLK